MPDRTAVGVKHSLCVTPGLTGFLHFFEGVEWFAGSVENIALQHLCFVKQEH
jgi:hypothetical protein